MITVHPAIEGLSPLPMAEDLDLNLLMENERRLSERPNANLYVPRLHQQSNRLELALRLKNPDLLEEVFTNLVDIAEFPDYDLGARKGVALRATQMSEELFWWRLYDKPMDNPSFLQTAYKNIVSLMGELPNNNPRAVHEYGILPELLVHGALLRRKDLTCVPCIASLRECSYGIPAENHNISLFHADATGIIKKLPVKVRGTQRSIWPRPRHPGVARITVVGALRQAMSQSSHPDIEELRAADLSYTTERGCYATLARCNFFKNLMVREIGNDPAAPTATPEDIAVLDAFSAAVLSRLSDGRNQAPEDRTCEKLEIPEQ